MSNEFVLKNSKLKTQNSKLALLILVFITLATIYSVVTPLGEGPDEPGHVRYMFFLAREGRLPIQQAAAASSDVPGEGHQPPLAYALVAPLAAWLPREERQFDMPGNPRFTWASPAAEAAVELNAVAHGSREYMPWRGFVLAWHLARLVSVALGAATVVLTYAIALSLQKRLEIRDWRLGEAQSPISNLQSPIALLAAGLVAFNPQFLFISALLTNDALLVTLSSALLWLAVRPQTMDDGRRTINKERRTTNDEHQSSIVYSLSSIQSPIVYAIVIGLVLGLALITKQSAIILAPIALLAVLEHSWLAMLISERADKLATGRADVTPSPRHLVTLSSLLAFVITTALLSGWWYARNWRLYGDLFGLAAFQAEFRTQAFDPASAAAWVAALGQLHGSFWARFGWMNVLPPGWVIWLFTAIEAGALIGWLLAWKRQGDKETRRQGDKETDRAEVSSSPLLLVSLSARRLGNGRWALVALPLLAFGWVISFALTAGLVAWQGRLLFPALPALAILLAWGLAAWQNREPRTKNLLSRNILGFLVLGSWFLIALWLPFGVIQPAYPLHTLPEATALERLGTQVYGRFGVAGEPGAELRGWTLNGTARAGDTPELTLIWHALGRQNRDWTVFIHLVDAQGQIVAEDNRPPQDDAFPMRQWVAGDWLEDRHPLALPAGLAPGEYHIRVGLFYPPTGRRAGVYSKRGTLRGDYLDIGTLTVRS